MYPLRGSLLKEYIHIHIHHRMAATEKERKRKRHGAGAKIHFNLTKLFAITLAHRLIN